ncbi:hypothetical protein EMCRGX_G022375 [Ephydatia muelleri]
MLNMTWLRLCVVVVLCVQCLCEEYTNSWAVEVIGGPEVADKIAERHDFVNLGRVGSLENMYHFVHRRSPSRSPRSLSSKHSDLMSEPEVAFVEQQKVHSRTKREVYTPPCDKTWNQQWYLHRPSGHDMNVESVWKQGVTGKGSVVSILDDGLEHKHPDLQANYDPMASYDFNDHDPDPQPRYDFSNENKHGTRCAGEVASSFCGQCGVGVAFNSKIGGVRMLDGDVTDVVEGSALSLNPQHIHIYSSSWGPNDDGQTVDGPGRLAQKALQDGITQGRGGLGSLFVWAGGNGGSRGDNCNCDGYVLSPYTIAVSSVSERDQKPWYVEECSSTLTSTYSSGGGDEKMIMSIDIRYTSPGNAADVCTNQHTGTSASAPIVAGMLALALEVNANLTWRDVQHIIVLASNPSFPSDPQWHKNGVGRLVSHKFGYGVLDGGALVNRARHWTTVPRQVNCTVDAVFNNRISSMGEALTVTITVPPTCPVTYLEHVQAIATISMQAGNRGSLFITLTSPQGTISTLLQQRSGDFHTDGFHNWPFMTVHTWGERPQGAWKFVLLANSGSRASLDALQLVVFGTEQIPVAVRNALERCDDECKSGCARPGPQYCDECRNFRVASSLVCVKECPSGTFPSAGVCWGCLPSCDKCSDQNTCLQCQPGTVLLSQGRCSAACPETTFQSPDGSCQPCHPSCFNCNGPTSGQCTSCPSQYVIVNGTCTMSCPPGYFLDGRTFACRVCHQSCAECGGKEASECRACYVGYVLQGGKCVPNRYNDCGPARYRDDKNGSSCVPCPPNCAECIDDITCTACQAGHYLESKRIKNSHEETKLCVSKCARGFFEDEATNSCQPCSHYCDSCDSYDNCTACTQSVVPQNGRCPQPCGERQYFDPNAQQCKPCATERCAQCYLGGVCSKCDPEFFLTSNRSCVASCPAHTVTNEETRECEEASCDSTCLTCSGPHPNQCLSCPEESTLYLSTCTRQCPPHTYSDGAACRHCHSTCDSCMGPIEDHCLTCPHGYLLDHFHCISTCPPRSFQYQSECLACPSNCERCTSATECAVCEAGYLLSVADLTCVASCPAVGFYEKGGHCVPCAQHCTACNEEQCLTCAQGYYYYPSRRECLASCPEGYYPDTSVCLECKSLCSSCKTPTECTVCVRGFRMDSASGMCQPCCNPDASLTQCCNCDASSTDCLWEANPTVVAAVLPSMGMFWPLVIGVVAFVVFAAALLVVLLVCYRCRDGSVSKQEYHALPVKEKPDISNHNDSGSDEDVHIYTSV